MGDLTGIGVELIPELEGEEDARFVAERPRSMELLEREPAARCRGVYRWSGWTTSTSTPPRGGARPGCQVADVDGHTYLDMYIADLSGFCGHAPPPVVEAVKRQIAIGNQFHLPSTDAIAVAEHLASVRNAEVAVHTVGDTGEYRGDAPRPHATGCEVILMFDGK